MKILILGANGLLGNTITTYFLGKKNYETFGIVRNSSKLYSFKKKYRVPFELLSDPNLKMQKKYGVWGVKTFMGKKFLGTIRSSVFIDNGKIKTK